METYYDIQQVKQIQRVNLHILKMIDNICKEAGCTYFLDSGTLLGAIRHNGFIPWDDDIDIIMFRKDYNIFKSYCQNGKLPFYFELTNTDGINGMFYDFIPRLTIKNSRFHKETEADLQFNNQQNRLCVDIFILDKMPQNIILFKIVVCLLKLLYGLSMGHRGKLKAKVTSCVVNAVSTLGKILPLFFIFWLRHVLLKTASCSVSNRVIASNYIFKELGTSFRSSWF